MAALEEMMVKQRLKATGRQEVEGGPLPPRWSSLTLLPPSGLGALENRGWAESSLGVHMGGAWPGWLRE